MDTPTDTRAAFIDPSIVETAGHPAQLAPALTDETAPDPERPRWGVLVAIALTASLFVFQLVVQVIFIVPYLFTHWTTDPEKLTATLTSPQVILLSIIAIIPAHLLTLALAWAIVTGFGKRPFWRSLGWRWSPRFGTAELFICLGATLLLLGVGQLMGVIFGDKETSLDRMILSSPGARYVIAALATFTAPLVEEVVFRGVLYSVLRKYIGVTWGASLVIAIFAAIHVPQYLPNVAAISTILLLSTVLTIVRARTGRLLPCFVIHLFFNGISSIFIVLSPFLQHATPPPSPAPTTPTGALIFLTNHAAHLFR